MDGSSSSVSSMSSGSKSSRRSKIIGGIIGGAVGLVLLLLCAHCLILSIRRRRLRKEIHDEELMNIKAAKEIRNRSNPSSSLRNPKNLSIATDKLRGMRPFSKTRPLPREPRSAPAIAKNAVHEEHGQPWQDEEKRHSSNANVTTTMAGMRADLMEDLRMPEDRPVGAQRPRSQHILQELRTPQVPPPRKAGIFDTHLEDPFA